MENQQVLDFRLVRSLNQVREGLAQGMTGVE